MKTFNNLQQVCKFQVAYIFLPSEFFKDKDTLFPSEFSKTKIFCSQVNVSKTKWIFTFEAWNAQIGLLTGKETVPLDKTGTAGLTTFNVAPNG